MWDCPFGILNAAPRPVACWAPSMPHRACWYACRIFQSAKIQGPVTWEFHRCDQPVAAICPFGVRVEAVSPLHLMAVRLWIGSILQYPLSKVNRVPVRLPQMREGLILEIGSIAW